MTDIQTWWPSLAFELCFPSTDVNGFIQRSGGMPFSVEKIPCTFGENSSTLVLSYKAQRHKSQVGLSLLSLADGIFIPKGRFLNLPYTYLVFAFPPRHVKLCVLTCHQPGLSLYTCDIMGTSKILKRRFSETMVLSSRTGCWYSRITSDHNKRTNRWKMLTCF